jgi:hypothetical protein
MVEAWIGMMVFALVVTGIGLWISRPKKTPK